jgi:hypothetical protein
VAYRAASCPPATNNKHRRGTRQGNETNERAPDPRKGCDGAPPHSLTQKRLSATDISALASMKNVAKCDTWCELQNPVNHRVFERKLRPKPSGRGHVCLGVTHAVAPPPASRRPPGDSRARGRGGTWPPVPARARSAQKEGIPVEAVTAGGGCTQSTFASRRVPSHRSERPARPTSDARARRPRRDPRSGGTTR